MSACLDETTLLAFLDGALAEEARATVEAHLAACAACAELATWAAAELAHPSRAPGQEGHPFVGGLAPGARVGRYQILGPVGRGGMGEVYAAYHPDLDRRIALKVVPGAGSDRAERWARLLREARTLARLSHPNVVQVYDAGTVGDGIYIAMEFVEGETLAAWLRAAPRSWPEILDVFAAAGRGLAAAHAAQIVHRDFKPQNVMIGNDGAVRVTDFGLARSVREAFVTHAPAADAAGLPATITKTGAVVGTPAYMAPEQFRGEAPDARADQFSFCVALHEALFGTRPALPHIGVASAPVDAKRTRAPTWLRAVVSRGLAPERADRYPSMDALLSALARGRTRLERRAAAATAALLVGLLSFAGWRVAHGGRVSCAVPQDRIDAAWTAPERRAAVHRVFAASGRASAETSWQRLSATLNNYVKQWGAMYVQSCEATHVRGEQSAEVLDLRMSCLNDNLDQVRALTDAVTEDAQAAAGAGLAVLNLTPVSRCADVALLRSSVPLPRDDRTLQTVLRLRRSLADVEAMREMGAPTKALARAVAMRAEVEAVGYRPLLGQLLAEIGLIETALGSRDAEHSLEEAVYVAESAHDDLTVATAADSLVYTVGQHPGRRKDAERWARLAAAVLDRLPAGYDSARLRSWVLNDKAAMLYFNGDYAPAEALMQEAIALKERLLGTDHPDVALSLWSLGAVLNDVGDPNAALPLIERAIRIYATRIGPDSPILARGITNRGDALRLLGRLDEAASAFRQAIVILERDPRTPFIIEPIAGLGMTELAEGQLSAALVHLERALELTKTVMYPPPLLADIQFTLGRALWDGRGDRVRARSLVQEARRTFQASNRVQLLPEADEWLASHKLAG